MIPNALFAFLHFIAAFGIAAALVFQYATFSRTPSLEEARRLQISDRWYGVLAALVLIVGFLRVFYFEKGSAFYFASPFFHIKLYIFAAIGIISIYPTVRYIAWGKQIKLGQAPKLSDREFYNIWLILRIELALLVAMLLSASLMSRGVMV